MQIGKVARWIENIKKEIDHDVTYRNIHSELGEIELILAYDGIEIKYRDHLLEGSKLPDPSKVGAFFEDKIENIKNDESLTV